MKLKLRSSVSHWVPVEVDDKGTPVVEFLIDYPTREAQEGLDELKYEAYGMSGVSVTELENLKFNGAKYLAYKRAFVEAVTKDWRGLKTEHGQAIPFNLENLWCVLRDEAQAVLLYEALSKELDFSEDDKKK